MRFNVRSKETSPHELDEADKTVLAPPAHENVRVSVRLNTPQPATEGKFYFENQSPPNITLGICDEGYPAGRWLGELQFKCLNVPQLMREGLNWTMENVSQEDGFFSPISSEYVVEFFMPVDLIGDGFTQTRHYFLRDLQQEPPRWIAHFQIHAREMKTLADFRLGDLSIDNVGFAVARSDLGKMIYLYKRTDSANAFNAIYDDMRMEGWWPWPKKG